MQIRIGWQNINIAADGIRVYRSTSQIVTSALPAVHDTLAGNAAEYIDTTVVKDTTYYYVFEVFKGTDKVFSPNIQATATKYSGPGSQTLLAGDLDAGYYGIVQASEFVTWDGLISALGVTLNTKTTQTSQPWLKFAHKGKTLYMPREPIGTISWNSLYLAGLVYGVDGVGPREYNTQTATNQLRTITVANSQFKVRLPTGLPPGFDLTKDFSTNTGNSSNVLAMATGGWTADSYDTVHDLTGSEWNDLLMKLLSWTPASQKGENFAALDGVLAWGGSSYTGFMDAGQLHQECLPGPTTPGRGNYSGSWHPGRMIQTSVSTARYWRPVLELIP